MPGHSNPKRGILARSVVIGLVAFVLAPPAAARAGTTITVETLVDATSPPADGLCGLREAILNANEDADATAGDCPAGSGEDRIEFSVSGTVPLFAALPPITDADGLMVDGEGAVTLSGPAAGRVMHVIAGAVLELDGLRVEGGLAPLGGAILNAGRLDIVDCGFFENQATVSGGAIWNGGVMNIDDSIMSSNSAGLAGGAVYSADDVDITDSRLSLNRAVLGGAVFNHLGAVGIEGGSLSHNRAEALGGALFNHRGPMGVFDATLSDNHAGVGGGAAYNDGSMNVSRDSLARNRTEGDGGALYSAGSLVLADSDVSGNMAGGYGGAVFSDSSVLSVRKSDLRGNHAILAGGAVHGDGAAMNISRSLFFDNSAGGFGSAVSSKSGTALLSSSAVVGNSDGALHAVEGSMSLSHSTVAGNTGGGVLADESDVTFARTIVAENAGGNCVGGPAGDFGYNLEFVSGGEASCGFSDHAVWGDPKLGPLDEQEGGLPSIAPRKGSAALDAVPIGAGFCGTSASDDLRGVPRPQGEACDIGAVEVVPALS